MSIAIRVLGSIVLVVDGSESAFGGPRAQAALGLLAMRAGQLVTLDWLIEQMWPGHPPRTARATVQSYVSRLRSAAGPDGRQAFPGSAHGYRLDLSVATVDVQAFERLANRGRERAAAQRWSESLIDLRAALALYQGSPYSGLDEVPALADDRRRLDELHQETSLTEWAALVHTGRADESVPLLRRFTVDHRWDERGWRLLMLALYQVGRQTEALQTGASARRMLVDEQGLDPSPELVALERQILNHDPALAAQPPRARSQPLWLQPVPGTLVGRAAEQTALTVAWRACRDSGHARLVLIRGEPGVGKSCLVAAFAAEIVATGGRILAGRCLDAPRLPLQPWSELIGPLLEEQLAAQPDSASSLIGLWEVTAHRLFTAVTERCQDELRAGPTLIVAEDLHWAGAAALRLLEHVLDVCADFPLLVVATLRTTAAGIDPTARAALGELTARNDPMVLDLAGLDPAALAELVSSHGHPIDPDVAQTLRTRTGGVPLLALEAVRGGTGMIDARLAALSERTSAVAELLALAGNATPLGILSAATDDEDLLTAALDDLERAGLVRSRPGTPVAVDFRHDLYREAIIKRLSDSRQLLLTRRLLRAADRVPTLMPPAALAAHALVVATSAAPADVVLARDACVRAAASESALHDHDEAMRWLQRARAQAVRLGADAAEIDLELGMAARLGGRPGSREFFLAAAAGARKQGDAALLARIGVGWSRGFFAHAGAVDSELVAVLRDALDAPSTLPETLRACAMAALAAELTWAPEGEDRFAIAEAAIALARSTGDLATLGTVLRAHQLTVAAADTLDARRRATDELLAIANQLDDVGLRFEALFHRCGPAIEFGDLPLIEASLEEASRIAEALRQPALQWSVGWSQASLVLWRGALPEAEERALAAARVGTQAGQPEAALFCGAQLLEIRRLQGRLDEVAAMLPPSPVGAADGFTTARYLIAVGRSGPVRATLTRLPHDRLHLRRDLLERPSLDNLAHCAAALGLTELGAAVGAALRPLADTFGHTVVGHPVGHHGLGVLALAAGRLDDAVRHLRQAVERHRDLGLALMEAESAVVLAEALNATGRTTAAGEMAARARHIAHEHASPGVLTSFVQPPGGR